MDFSMKWQVRRALTHIKWTGRAGVKRAASYGSKIARRHAPCKHQSCVGFADVRSYAPWALMGRVKKSGDLLEENSDLKVQLKLNIAAKDLNQEASVISERYSALLSLLPEFEDRLIQLPQTQVSELLADVNTIAARMVRFQFMLIFMFQLFDSSTTMCVFTRRSVFTAFLRTRTGPCDPRRST